MQPVIVCKGCRLSRGVAALQLEAKRLGWELEALRLHVLRTKQNCRKTCSTPPSPLSPPVKPEINAYVLTFLSDAASPGSR